MMIWPNLLPETVLIPLLSALAVLFVGLAVTRPVPVRDRLREKVNLVTAEARRAAAAQGSNPTPRRTRRLSFLLSDEAEAKLAQKHKQAGIREPQATEKYVAWRIGWMLILAAGAFAYASWIADQPVHVVLMATVGMGLVGWMMPALLLLNRIQKRQTAIQRSWPNALDLLLVCVESGNSLEASLQRVTQEIGQESLELAEEFATTVAEMSYLPERRLALENLAMRTGLESVRSVVSTLKQAEKHGTAVGAALRVLSQESRDLRLSEAERKAAALPPKLTVPMILFFLPVLFVVIMTPAFISIFRN
jgi:tight adherence protein C